MRYSSKKIIGSLSYKFTEQLAVKGTSLIVGIVLARLLNVKDFGVISLLTVFTNFASAIIEGGLSTSLIQKKEIDSEDYSTVFYTSCILAILLYVIIYFFSPWIAVYYGEAEMSAYLRIIALNLFATPFNAVQLGYVYRNMLFKKLLVASLSASITSGGIGIILAYIGIGPWALVVQALLSSLISVGVLFFIIPWKPTAEFAFSKLKEHFRFGWKLLASSLLDTGYIELRTLLIGKRYTTTDLSFYNRGDTYPKTIMTSLNTAVQTVMFPVLAGEQSNIEEVKNISRKTVMLSSVILFPVMAGFAAIAEGFVEIVLTDKWEECVIYLQLACLTYAMLPINSCNLQAIKAIGRSDIFLRLTLIKKVIGIMLIVIAIFSFDSPLSVAIVAALYAPLELLINAFPNKKLLSYSIFEQLADILPAFGSSLVMFLIVELLNFAINFVYIKVIIQIIVGVCVYILCSLILQRKIVKELVDTIKINL